MTTIGIQIDTNAAQILRQMEGYTERARTAIRQSVARQLILEKQAFLATTGVTFRRGARGLQGRVATFATSLPGIGFDAGIGFRKTSGFPYELAQEFGAKAKPGRAMSIPVTPKARKAGSPRNMKAKLFVPHGTHVLAESTGLKGFRKTGSTFIVHYVLVKSIKARLGFRSSLSGAGERISGAIRDGLKEASWL